MTRSERCCFADLFELLLLCGTRILALVTSFFRNPFRSARVNLAILFETVGGAVFEGAGGVAAPPIFWNSSMGMEGKTSAEFRKTFMRITLEQAPSEFHMIYTFFSRLQQQERVLNRMNSSRINSTLCWL